jgi:hypothetical protein
MSNNFSYVCRDLFDAIERDDRFTSAMVAVVRDIWDWRRAQVWDNFDIQINVARVGRRYKMSDNTVRTAVKALIKIGFMRATKITRGKPTKYRINESWAILGFTDDAQAKINDERDKEARMRAAIADKIKRKRATPSTTEGVSGKGLKVIHTPSTTEGVEIDTPSTTEGDPLNHCGPVPTKSKDLLNTKEAAGPKPPLDGRGGDVIELPNNIFGRMAERRIQDSPVLIGDSLSDPNYVERLILGATAKGSQG